MQKLFRVAAIFILGMTGVASSDDSGKTAFSNFALFKAIDNEIKASHGMSLKERLKWHGSIGMTLTLSVGKEDPISRHFGLRNVKKSLPTDNQTLYPADTVSKLIAGLVFATADSRNKLKLDRTLDSVAEAKTNGLVGKWRKKFFEGKAARKTGVDGRLKNTTIEDLLSHRGALSMAGIGAKGKFSRCRKLEHLIIGRKAVTGCHGVRPVPELKPGESWEYSTGGYLIAEAAFAQVVGMPFEKAARDWIFKRIGMTRSFYWDKNTNDLNIARGCSSSKNCSSRLLTGDVHAPLGLVAHPQEFARLIQHIGYNGRAFDSNGSVLIPMKTLRKALRPRSSNGYALGSRVSQRDFKTSPIGVAEFSHSGADRQGFRSEFVFNVDKKLGLTLFINGARDWSNSKTKGRGSDAFGREIVRAFREVALRARPVPAR